jgi:arginyl-tRNA synthetase
MNILAELRRRFEGVLASLTEDPAPLLEMVLPSQDARHGDYQANCAMPLGKQLGQSPPEIAREIISKLQLDDLCQSAELAGPGFINLRLADSWLADQLNQLVHDPQLGLQQSSDPQTVIIDFSSPNVAKPMHVGHIRSTVIGDALVRSFRCLGHNVISDNHLGDWGTQFGMIIYGYKHFVDEQKYQQNPVAELSRLYQQVNQLIDYQKVRTGLDPQRAEIGQRQQQLSEQRDRLSQLGAEEEKKQAKQVRRLESQLAALQDKLASNEAAVRSLDDDPSQSELVRQHADVAESVLQETALLHQGDDVNRGLWEQFLPHCRQEIEKIYQRLGVQFDVQHGESFYHTQLAGVVESLEHQGLAELNDGAVCVFSDQFETPMIVRKQDGAFLYATTDLATIQYRIEQWDPDLLLYVVDHRQSEHFDKLFDAARRWQASELRMQHVSFGTVLGEDGRPYKTRSGTAVGLEGLLDEAVNKAHEVVTANDEAKPSGAELSEQERDHVADVIGHGAIKYADLSHNRSSDYVFSYDKMMALEGNTATYMQYCYARVQSIFRRGEVDIDGLRSGFATIQLEHPAERELAIGLLQLPEALELVVADYRPNHLTNYLFVVAKRFASFFEQCPVLKAENDTVRDSRLLLCDLVARVIQHGLDLLGIDVVDRM